MMSELYGSGQPLDTMRVRAQIAARGQYRNTWDIAVQTVRKEGFFAMFGCSVPFGL